MVKQRLVVFVNLSESPNDSAWEAYVDAVKEASIAHGTARILVVSEGGPPTPKQRKLAAEAARAAAYRSAVVSDKFIARTIATALSWLKVDIKAFTVAEMSDALSFLELTAAESAWALEAVREMKEELRREAARAHRSAS